VFNKRVHLLVKRILMLSKCTVQQLKKSYMKRLVCGCVAVTNELLVLGT